jgi:hypothetical protein
MTLFSVGLCDEHNAGLGEPVGECLAAGVSEEAAGIVRERLRAAPACGRVAAPTASPADASPADASPADASPADRLAAFLAARTAPKD